jgi:tRNA G18 (ribose-2'-O)-methylase SpoU
MLQLCRTALPWYWRWTASAILVTWALYFARLTSPVLLSAFLRRRAPMPLGPKAVRASAGSVFHLHVASSTPQATLHELRAANLPLVTAVAHGGEDCFCFDWPRRCALVLGHETRGVSSVLDEAATHRVTIPNYGRAESLNVAAAGAVLLFAWRQSVVR